jgi:hypothetical protein
MRALALALVLGLASSAAAQELTDSAMLILRGLPPLQLELFGQVIPNNCKGPGYSCRVGPLKATTGTFSGAISGDGLTSTSPVLIPSGTVGAPSLAFSADADGTGTGLYRTGANAFSVATNGVERLQFYATGEMRFLGAVQVTSTIQNVTGGFPISVQGTHGFQIQTITSLETCSATWLNTFQFVASAAAVPSKLCVCRFTATGSVYAWDNVFSTTANAARSTTNCSD